MNLLNLDDYKNKVNRWLMTLSKLDDQKIKDIKSTINKLKPVMSEDGLKYVYDSVREVIKNEITSASLKQCLQALVLVDMQRWLNPTEFIPDHPNRSAMLDAIKKMSQEEMAASSKEKLLKDALTKGAPTSQISPHTQIRLALDRIITKLAALSHPLGLRRDYGTTKDMSEQIKKIKSKLEKAAFMKTASMEAMMIKPVPAMKDYDSFTQGRETPEALDYDTVETLPPPSEICPHCGQPMPKKQLPAAMDGPAVEVIPMEDQPVPSGCCGPMDRFANRR